MDAASNHSQHCGEVMTSSINKLGRFNMDFKQVTSHNKREHVLLTI
jgi:hypothetical protein